MGRIILRRNDGALVDLWTRSSDQAALEDLHQEGRLARWANEVAGALIAYEAILRDGKEILRRTSGSILWEVPSGEIWEEEPLWG